MRAPFCTIKPFYIEVLAPTVDHASRPHKPLWKTLSEELNAKPESCRSQEMTAANVLKSPALGREDDAGFCVDHMRPHVQALLNYAVAQYKSGAGVVWALQWGYADLLHQFAGDMAAVEAVAAAYLEISDETDRAAARDCQKRVQEMLTGSKLKGFSTSAIAWAMVGALSSINRHMAFANVSPKHAKREADEYTAQLIKLLNHARRATVN
jgi:hypothetical protein